MLVWLLLLLHRSKNMKESDWRPYCGFAKTLKGPLNEPLKQEPKERNKTNNPEQLSVENVNVMLSDIEYLIKY